MARDQLITWLNDAYAMEMALIAVLQNHAGDVRATAPDAATRLDQHVIETRMHADRIEQCLAELDSTPSRIKSAFSSVIGQVESTATGLFSDAPVKNALMDYGAEQVEVGCYHALATPARQLGLERVAALCELNLREDEAMALWLREQIPAVVRRALGTSV